MSAVDEAAPTAELRYRLLIGAIRFLLRLLCRVRVDGLANAPLHGPMIVLTNHLHFLDALVVPAVLPVRMTVLAAEKWETRPIVNRLFKAVNAVFINRGAADRAALMRVEERLKQGAIVGIAPEGTRSPTGALQEGKGGAAFLGSRTGAAMLPMVLYGQEKASRAWRRLHRVEIFVRIGQPFKLSPIQGSRRSQQNDAMTQDIMLRIARLLPPEYQGVYRPLVEREASD
jgi:1-acyl-sn-glycerol-3-phosphate acyltransferase